MAGRAGLKSSTLALLVLGVVLVHVAVVDRVRAMLDTPSVLKPMPVVMYTRVLTPAAVVAPPPPPVVATRRPAKKKPAVVPASPASAPEPSPVPQPEPARPEAPPPPAEPAPAAVAAEAPASAPAGPDLSSWPADTRLTYRLGGQFRSGPLHGDAQVKWQRDGARYQVRVDVNVTLWATLVMTSQGEVAPEGLSPSVYEEETNRRKRRHARFDAESVHLENGRIVPRPAGVQDTASQFVELGHRFANGRAVLKPGETVQVWLGRPGAVDLWTYDISGPETLATPKLGAIEAYHLTPRPIANPRGNIYAELWYAPSLQYLPVRIKLRMGENDYIDLAIDTIEQK